LKRDVSRFSILIAHDLFGKLRHTFPDHALSTRAPALIPGCFGSPGFLFPIVIKAEALTTTPSEGADNPA
jgi:hypothetical protein